jgi:hypothetical protein
MKINPWVNWKRVKQKNCEDTMKTRLIMPESNYGAEDLKMTSSRPIDF